MSNFRYLIARRECYIETLSLFYLDPSYDVQSLHLVQFLSRLHN